MDELHPKKRFSTIALTVLVGMTVVTSLFFLETMKSLNSAYADIMQVESISSTTQRQINLASNNEHLERDVFVINESTQNALSEDGEARISLMSDPTIALLANQVLEEWLTIDKILSVNWELEEGQEKQELDYISLRLARDAHFKAMTDLSNGIADYTYEFNSKITQYQLMMSVLVFLIAMIVLNNTLQTRAELVISKELAKKAQIDSATGLYNRSRCQEIFKSNHHISNHQQPAIMVLDLNDLKKTNDSLGHRVGDELIFTFATLLKEACGVHKAPPFIGRYGGDEFVIYYEDVKEDEVQLYLKELEIRTGAQNERETRFQVSYAVGYSCVRGESEERMTARQLFDEADEAMYVNKIEGKRKKNPNYDEEVSRGEVR